MKKFILFLFFVVSIVVAQTAENENLVTASANPTDVAFSNVSISIEAGEIYPMGDLMDAVENSHYIGMGFRYSYWDNVDGVVMFSYSYFKPEPDYVVFDGAHQFSGKLGLDWKFSKISPVILGVGFTCNWVRADVDDDVDKATVYVLPGGTLTDNETEFGWYGRVNIPFVNYEKFKIGLNVMWEELWTLPKRSDMLSAGIYVERSLW